MYLYACDIEWKLIFVPDKVAKIAYFLSPLQENFIIIIRFPIRFRGNESVFCFPFPIFLRVFIAIFELYNTHYDDISQFQRY